MRTIADSFRPSKLEKRLVQLLKLERGTLRRKFAPKFVELMKDAATPERRCLMILSLGDIRRQPKMQQKLLDAKFYEQLCAWGKETISTITPWPDGPHSREQSAAHELCLHMLVFLANVGYVKELAVAMSPFIMSCKNKNHIISFRKSIIGLINFFRFGDPKLRCLQSNI